ncbi:MAG: molybdate ABC transporter substrate-binding protein, partial [Phenylobacterium sp.]
MSLTRRTLAGLIALAPTRAWASEGPLIAAASDLTSALPLIAERFRRAGGGPVRLTFGSSGALTRQIEAGAPFEVFLSAEASLARRLVASGRAEGPGRIYGQGRLVLFARKGSRVRPAGGSAELVRALKDGRIRRMAIANPDHAPYGRAAREALTALGVWTLAAPRLVLGDSAAQAARFALSGGADAGLLPLSLALGPELARAGAYGRIDPTLHAPLVQTAV